MDTPLKKAVRAKVCHCERGAVLVQKKGPYDWEFTTTSQCNADLICFHIVTDRWLSNANPEYNYEKMKRKIERKKRIIIQTRLTQFLKET